MRSRLGNPDPSRLRWNQGKEMGLDVRRSTSTSEQHTSAWKGAIINFGNYPTSTGKATNEYAKGLVSVLETVLKVTS